MGEFGTLTLVLALGLAAYGTVGSLLGARLRLAELAVSARYALYLNVLVLGLSVVNLVAAFLRHDFTIAYVYSHSSLAMPPQYTWVAFYAGNEGSLLFIAFALAALTALAVRTAPRRVLASLPYTITVLGLVQVFFLAVLAFLANPFAPLTFVARDGLGINPLLTHPGMFFHPPTLMTGLVAVSIPYAFAMGALLSGKVGDEWVEAGRVWSMAAWLILGLGLLLGAWWAYTILGWGGYWAWDPVENAGLLPWLGLTAFIHSIMVQARRGMFRMWNIALISTTFVLACFGMFINRGGPVPSVHSFGASTLGWVFLLFMGAVAVASFAIFFWRYDRLRSDAALESTFSREAAFLVNNLLLLSIAFVTMWGVMYPLISEILRGQTVSVGEPFYNQVNGPLILGMVFLMGIGPLLPWRQATWRSFLRVLAAPGATALLIMVALALLGVRNLYALLSFGLAALVVGGVLEEWARGVRVRHAKGEGYGLAFLRLLGSNRPRYGGYIVHLAIVMLALGVTGSSFFETQRDVVMTPGRLETVRGYTLEYLGVTRFRFPDREEQRAEVRVLRDGHDLGVFYPQRTSYPEQRLASTQAAIRSTPVEDLYIIPNEFLDDGRAVFRVMVNPLVWWMWLAGPVMLLGTVIALWPKRRVAPAPAVQRSPVRHSADLPVASTPDMAPGGNGGA